MLKWEDFMKYVMTLLINIFDYFNSFEVLILFEFKCLNLILFIYLSC